MSRVSCFFTHIVQAALVPKWWFFYCDDLDQTQHVTGLLAFLENLKSRSSKTVRDKSQD